MKITVIVASHKAVPTPPVPNDPLYLPVFAGAAGKPGILPDRFLPDNQGDQISAKNPYYCELTCLYYGWKNLSYHALGLAHYRRYFMSNKRGKKAVLTDNEAQNLLKQTNCILPNKRRYYIETNYSHYVHAHNAEGIDKTLQIIREHYPQYAKAADTVMNRTWAHMFNMFIMEKSLCDRYCGWLFELLGRLEQELDITNWDKSEQRVFGYVAELMTDVFLLANDIGYIECRVRFLQKQNWLKKGGAFIWRKIKNRRKSGT
jgi:hypothetical protein